MNLKSKSALSVLFAIAILAATFAYVNDYISSDTESTRSEKLWSTKKTKIKSGADAYSKPDGFIEYFNAVSKKIGEENSNYAKGYRGKELSNALVAAKGLNKKANNVTFTSRGPNNVGGRTRAIAIDPDDNTHCTWIAGAASGGIWKTTDCGLTWTNIGEGLPNLSTNSIAQAPSNPDVIYVGTGEVFAGNSTFVRGDGIYKSTDRGNTWSLLASTVNNTNYVSVNRIAVDPADDNILVIATNTGIYRSTDGGQSWVESFDAPAGGSVQDLQVDPTDFNVQYAGVNSNGIFKSIDGGISWSRSSDGIANGVRFEIAVAPSDPSIVYTSSFEGETTILYFSEDYGVNWVRVEDDNYDTNFLGAQGWYDNTIEVNPYNPLEVYVGGVSIGKYLVDPSVVTESERQFLGLDNNTSFLSFIAFGATFNNGTLDIADGDLSPSTDPVTVEIRWGGANVQKAHRFTVPSDGGANGDGGAGIAPTEYLYQDYIDVPFEVWDIENNRQLMVSFRDQENDGEYDLNPRDDTNDPALLTAREYFYIHDIEYNATTPSSDVSTTTGGIQFANMYYFWPILSDNATWDPASFNGETTLIKFGTLLTASADALAVYDAYGNWASQNRANLHPDHHHLTFIKTDEANQKFMVINGNDGAFGFSEDNGVTFEEREEGYITSQFYGADKKPGEDRYIGGMQDNGTWISSGTTVDATNNYDFRIGGDGFEVLWHAKDPNLVIGGSQFNGLRRSTNGGESFSGATAGMESDGPFITRIAGSVTSPDIIYAISATGVYKSTNFGESWTRKAITADTWGGATQSADVEVSLANDQIVWAGNGMAEGALDMFVSTDAGETYSPVNLPANNPGAFSTGIYTHPKDENTAYVLFSVANQAKIYKTEDLGQTWTDLSGFDTGGNESDNGFPDVYTHSLLVMPYNTDIIWVGTEIGLFESLDGGASWNFRNDIPSVSIWSMKVVDDQVVIGTHGRGIWTATIEELQFASLAVNSFSYNGYGSADLSLSLPVAYDQVEVFVAGQSVETVTAPAAGLLDVSLSGFDQFDGTEISIVGSLNGSDYESTFNTPIIDAAPEILEIVSNFNSAEQTYPVAIELENNEPFDKVEVYFNDNLVYTDTQVLTETDGPRMIEFDYTEKATNQVKLISFIGAQEFTTIYSRNFITANEGAIDAKASLYPNPVRNKLSIELENGIQKVQVYTTAGRLLFSDELANAAQQYDLDMSIYDQGMYLVQYKDAKGKINTKRIIKN